MLSRKKTYIRITVYSFFVSLGLAAPVEAELFNNSANTVYDTKTGLTWLKQDDGVARNHPGSLTYAQGLDADGLGCTWRLPNMTELLGIVDTTRTNPAIDPIFLSTKSAGYWSATADGASSNWRGVNFLDGSSMNAIKDTELHYSRPVADNCLQQMLYCCDGDSDGVYSAQVSGTCSGTGCEPAGCSADVDLALDCNDGNPNINPGVAEICGDGIDNDCDGFVDDDGAGSTSWYADFDGDNYGNPAIAQAACSKSTGWVANNTDCNDNDAAMFPNNPEICDGKDNNCNSVVDEGVDGDGDGVCDVTDNCGGAPTPGNSMRTATAWAMPVIPASMTPPMIVTMTPSAAVSIIVRLRPTPGRRMATTTAWATPAIFALVIHSMTPTTTVFAPARTSARMTPTRQLTSVSAAAECPRLIRTGTARPIVMIFVPPTR
ncbi:MAG: hypothetical protein BM485_05845 [Desulfobulbaceae bacterium DB1]|nr:MAG: hypothetical protein BM485_05845 [Desulfobulbaceae bacterium DB1]